MLKIGITGHRKFTNTTEVRQQIAEFLQEQTKTAEAILAISPLAVGADTIFAEEALKAGIRLRVLLPFALAEYGQDFAPNELQHLNALIAQAGGGFEVVTTLADNTPDTRNEAYMAIGRKITEASDILIAVWDGKIAHGKGGTADVVAYAQAQGKRVFVIEAIR